MAAKTIEKLIWALIALTTLSVATVACTQFDPASTGSDPPAQTGEVRADDDEPFENLRANRNNADDRNDDANDNSDDRDDNVDDGGQSSAVPAPEPTPAYEDDDGFNDDGGYDDGDYGDDDDDYDEDDTYDDGYVNDFDGGYDD
jgi:hypothetical protein